MTHKKTQTSMAAMKDFGDGQCSSGSWTDTKEDCDIQTEPKSNTNESLKDDGEEKKPKASDETTPASNASGTRRTMPGAIRVRGIKHCPMAPVQGKLVESVDCVLLLHCF